MAAHFCCILSISYAFNSAILTCDWLFWCIVTFDVRFTADYQNNTHHDIFLNLVSKLDTRLSSCESLHILWRALIFNVPLIVFIYDRVFFKNVLNVCQIFSGFFSRYCFIISSMIMLFSKEEASYSMICYFSFFHFSFLNLHGILASPDSLCIYSWLLPRTIIIHLYIFQFHLF